jgi:endonuclease III
LNMPSLIPCVIDNGSDSNEEDACAFSSSVIVAVVSQDSADEQVNWKSDDDVDDDDTIVEDEDEYTIVNPIVNPASGAFVYGFNHPDNSVVVDAEEDTAIQEMEAVEEDVNEMEGDKDDEDYEDDDEIRLHAESLTRNKRRNRHLSEAKHARVKLQDIVPHTGQDRMRPTAERVQEWNDTTLLNLKKDNRLLDGTMAFQSTVVKKPKPYSDKMTMFFLTCSIQEFNPFDFCEVPAILGGRVKDSLEFSGWKYKRIGNSSMHLTTILETSHAQMASCWDEQKAKYRLSYKYKEWSLVELPECPSLVMLKSQVRAGRNLLHQLWHCFPDAESRDVRDQVLEWMLQELLPCNTRKEFDAKVNDKCRTGIIHRMVKAGKNAVIASYPHLRDPTAPKKAAEIKIDEEKKRKKKALVDKKRQQREMAANPKEEEKKNKTKKRHLPMDMAEARNKKLPKTEDALQKPAMVANLRGGGEEIRLEGLGLEPNLEGLLKAYRLICIEEQCPDNAKHAINGTQRKSLQEIWIHYNGAEGKDCDMSPPLLNFASTKKQDYKKPGEQFACMGRDALQVLEMFLTSCGHRAVAPMRWNWEYELMNKLGLLDSEDRDLRDNAMMICLILSAATTDKGCIESTVRLHQNGLLNLKKLATANLRTISNLILGSGINDVKSIFLRNMAIKCQHTDFGGKLPWSFDHLQAIKGVGRKTGVLFMNEAFGFDFGIGCDSHVFLLSKAWGFLLQSKGKKPAIDAEDAENALREWIPRYDYKKTNKIFGSFGQLVSQDLKSISRKAKLVNSVLRAMDDYIHKPYHIEMLWFLIKSARQQYGV